MNPVVLDASAVLALINCEPGEQAVAAALAGARLSAVNWAEIAQRLGEVGVPPAEVREELGSQGLAIDSFTAVQAEAAARLRPPTRQAGLSLADRAALALAEELDAPVLTADRAWTALDLPVEVRLIR